MTCEKDAADDMGCVKMTERYRRDIMNVFAFLRLDYWMCSSCAFLHLYQACT